ncbi:MAG: DUF4214 domain-containing protein [Desulfuromonas sp.]|nr:DUF4214 domain-containing protein [Desulfuromonas sp.]
MVRTLLCIVLLLSGVVSTHAAVTMAVSQQSGAAVRERADQLAGQIGGGLGTTVSVVVLPDAAQVEEWLNRYATAELALIEANYVAGKPGQFVVIGPVGHDLTLIGRQGISGDLPQRIAGVLAGTGGHPAAVNVKTLSAQTKAAEQLLRTPTAGMNYSSSKSASEDRYFVSSVYREKLNREPSAERLDYWTRQLQSGAVTKRQLFEMVCSPEVKGCEFE